MTKHLVPRTPPRKVRATPVGTGNPVGMIRGCRKRGAGLVAAALVALALGGASLLPGTASALGGANAGAALTTPAGLNGYAIISAAGGQYNYGGSTFTGSLAGTPLNAPVVDAANPTGHGGTWMAASDGGVFALGGAPFLGSMGGHPLNQPITAILSSPSGAGYLLVARDGGTFAYGDYPGPGSLAGMHLSAPIVDAARAPNGGLWLVAADGGVFALGGAPFLGSMGNRSLNQPITAIVSSPSGSGYLLVARDGGTFAYGSYPNPGSLSGIRLNAPVVDATASVGNGLWMLAEDGGIFSLSAPFYGAATAEANPALPGATVGSPSTVAVPCSNGGSITVAAQISRSLSDMLAAARTAGATLCGSGYRDPSQQIALRRKNCGTTTYDIYQKPSGSCSPPTAKPGTSMHEKGLAIDFNSCSSHSTACWKWLNANAGRFGFHNLPSESWHWSTTGR